MNFHFFLIRVVIFLCLISVSVKAFSAAPPHYPENDWHALSTLLADKYLPMSWHDDMGRPIEFYQLKYGSEATAIRQIKAKKRKGKLSDKHIDTLLAVAIESNAQSAANYLIRIRNPQSKISLSESGALIWAATFGRLEMVRMLIHEKVDLYASNGGNDAFEAAFYFGQCNVANLLVDSGLDPSRYKSKNRTGKLFFYAIDAGNSDCLSLLKTHSFDFHFLDDRGDSLLAYIIEQNASEKLADLVVLFGADPCKVNALGETAQQLVERIHAKTIQQSRPKYVSLYDGRESACKGISARR